jgi:hypothetical protein
LVNEFNKIWKLQEELKVNKFNNSLPLTIEILQQTSYNRYLVKFGNKTISTKSLKELKTKTKYWAEFKSVKDSINLSNLIEQPLFLQKQFDSFLLEGSKLESLLKIENFNQKIKTELFKQLYETTIKEEFEFISSILLSFKNKVVTLPLLYKGKLEFIQVRTDSQNSCEFYFGFKNIGPIGGYIIDEVLSIFCAYDSSLKFLKDRVKNLKKLSIQHIMLDKNIKPLFSVDDIGLNLKV